MMAQKGIDKVIKFRKGKMEAIKKLRDKGIFNDSQSIVESMIQKNWLGEPVIKRSLLELNK